MLARTGIAVATVASMLALCGVAAAGESTTRPAKAPATQPALSTNSGQATTKSSGQAATAPAVTELPLSSILAYRMPGTEAMESSDDPALLSNDSRRLAAECLQALPHMGADLRGGFVVAGRGRDALQEAHAVLVDNKAPAANFSKDQKLSLVFFSCQLGFNVHITKVAQRGGDTLDIAYKFVPRGDSRISPQIAIIPLDDISSGMLKIILRGKNDPSVAPTPGPSPMQIAGEEPAGVLAFG